MRVNRKKEEIRQSIKLALGYEISDSDDSVLKDWKERKSRVCKPCWELKYCPYGPLVEQSPHLPSLRKDSEDQIQYFKDCLASGLVGSKEQFSDERRADYEEWLNDEQVLLNQAWTSYTQQKRLKTASSFKNEADQIAAWLGGPLPSVHIYRTSYQSEEQDINEEMFDKKTWKKIIRLVEKTRKKYKLALDSGVDDNRHTLEPARRAWFQKVVDEYDPDDHPQSIPTKFSEAECNVFGHICPVFFAAEALTETKESRRIGRRPIPFSRMMRIVRRDDYRCQHCKKKLRDDEVEFDHIIPVSKGGSSEEHNLRLTCFDCNHDKSDTYDP